MYDFKFMKVLEIQFEDAWFRNDRKEMIFYEMQLSYIYKKINYGHIQTNNGE